jgi:HTH-type transcriptional regulator/antitoxin HigA
LPPVSSDKAPPDKPRQSHAARAPGLVQCSQPRRIHVALVNIYEAKRWPIEIDETFDPIEVLQCAIGELSHSQAELAELLGSRSRASEVLSGRSALTVEMIHKIGEGWKIPADLLVRPYKVERAA